MKNILTAIFIILVLGLAAAFLPMNRLNWGTISWKPAETVTVLGEARSVVKNQIASFTAGVDAVNMDKNAAVSEVNSKVEALIKAVKEFGIKAEDIKTQNMSIYQNEEPYYENGVQRMRKGQWRVSNSVEITLRNLDDATKLADLLTNSGATNVYGPNFRMDDTSEAEKGLFDLAMKEATEKAGIAARSAGRTLGKVLVVTEGGSGSPVMPLFAARMESGGGGAPMESGSGTVSKTLTVTFELR